MILSVIGLVIGLLIGWLLMRILVLVHIGYMFDSNIRDRSDDILTQMAKILKKYDFPYFLRFNLSASSEIISNQQDVVF